MCISLTMQESCSCVQQEAEHGWYIPSLNLHTIPLLRYCKLQSISSFRIKCKKRKKKDSCLYENIFNVIITFSILPCNVQILYFFPLHFNCFISRGSLFSGCSYQTGRLLSFFFFLICFCYFLTRCLIFTVVHQQRQHYRCDNLYAVTEQPHVCMYDCMCAYTYCEKAFH